MWFGECIPQNREILGLKLGQQIIDTNKVESPSWGKGCRIAG